LFEHLEGLENRKQEREREREKEKQQRLPFRAWYRKKETQEEKEKKRVRDSSIIRVSRLCGHAESPFYRNIGVPSRQGHLRPRFPLRRLI